MIPPANPFEGGEFDMLQVGRCDGRRPGGQADARISASSTVQQSWSTKMDLRLTQIAVGAEPAP